MAPALPFPFTPRAPALVCLTSSAGTFLMMWVALVWHIAPPELIVAERVRCNECATNGTLNGNDFRN